METKIGKIHSIKIGFADYKDCQLGISVIIFGGGKDLFALFDFKGFWSGLPDSNAQWTIQDQRNALGDALLWLGEILKLTGKKTVEELVGVPVEVTFEDNMVMKSWRVLEEVI